MSTSQSYIYVKLTICTSPQSLQILIHLHLIHVIGAHLIVLMMCRPKLRRVTTSRTVIVVVHQALANIVHLIGGRFVVVSHGKMSMNAGQSLVVAIETRGG